MAKSELEKHSETFDKRVTLTDFLDWFDVRGYFVCYYSDREQELARPIPIPETQGKLLDEYFGIDAAQLEAERRELIRKAREAIKK